MPICTAHTSSGRPCRAKAIAGGNVCVTHGGSAPQVKAAARRRLAAMVNPALSALAKSLKSTSSRIRLDAAKDVLDRNGLKDPDRMQIEGSLNLLHGDIDNAIDRLLAKATAGGEVPAAVEAGGACEATHPAG